jgi:hypothetical protein
VLDEKGGVEADERQPEVQLAQPLVQQRPVIFGNQKETPPKVANTMVPNKT